MQNYDGQFKLNGKEYFYRAKDDSGSSKITRDNNEDLIKVSNSRIVNVMVKKVIEKVWQTVSCLA